MLKLATQKQSFKAVSQLINHGSDRAGRIAPKMSQGHLSQTMINHTVSSAQLSPNLHGKRTSMRRYTCYAEPSYNIKDYLEASQQSPILNLESPVKIKN